MLQGYSQTLHPVFVACQSPSGPRGHGKDFASWLLSSSLVPESQQERLSLDCGIKGGVPLRVTYAIGSETSQSPSKSRANELP